MNENNPQIMNDDEKNKLRDFQNNADRKVNSKINKINE